MQKSLHSIEALVDLLQDVRDVFGLRRQALVLGWLLLL
jgi:hypothetical protein